jgi:hypothetical protein
MIAPHIGFVAALAALPRNQYKPFKDRLSTTCLEMRGRDQERNVWAATIHQVFDITEEIVTEVFGNLTRKHINLR